MLSRWHLLHRLVKPAVPPVYPRHFDVENHLGCCLALGISQKLHMPPRWPCGPTRCRPSISCRLLVHPRCKVDPLRHRLLSKITFLGTFVPYRDVTILGEITLLGEVAVWGKLGLGCHPWQIRSCHPWQTRPLGNLAVLGELTVLRKISLRCHCAVVIDGIMLVSSLVTLALLPSLHPCCRQHRNSISDLVAMALLPLLRWRCPSLVALVSAHS
jgi:hypothetical protein